MVSKGSAAYSILKSKCPRCNEGDYFIGKNPYSSLGLKMHERCSHCDLKYDMEPGFYLGAMYISYLMGVALTLPIVFICFLLFDVELYVLLVLGLVILIAMMPISYRLSRIIWINFFVHYTPT